jgi:hypothetical protein
LILLFATGVVDTGGKLIAGVVDTGGKIATDVVDTNSKVDTCVVDAAVVDLDLRISLRIFLIFGITSMLHRGLGGR